MKIWLVIEYAGNKNALIMAVTNSDNIMSIANRYKPIAITAFRTKKEAEKRVEKILK